MEISRRVAILTSIAGAASVAGKSLHAATFPTRPIRIVVPYSAGGVTDILSRLIADKAAGHLNDAKIFVDNRPGASGMLGTAQVAKAPPDGYTILMGSIAPLVIAKIVVSDLPYDPFLDLAPITQIAQAPVVLVVHPSMPAHNAQELLQLLKSNPGKFNYSSAGAGTPSHLACELFKQRFGVDMLHVPYKGTGASFADLIAGRVQLTMETAAGVIPFINSGQLRPLGVASVDRSPLLKEVPTIEEQGLGQFEVSGWYGYLAPKDTPGAVIDALRNAISSAVNQPDVTARLIELGAVPKTSSPEEFRILIQQEHERWTPVVKSLDLNFK